MSEEKACSNSAKKAKLIKEFNIKTDLLTGEETLEQIEFLAEVLRAENSEQYSFINQVMNEANDLQDLPDVSQELLKSIKEDADGLQQMMDEVKKELAV